jgi:methyl halide transferase
VKGEESRSQNSEFRSQKHHTGGSAREDLRRNSRSASLAVIEKNPESRSQDLEAGSNRVEWRVLDSEFWILNSEFFPLTAQNSMDWDERYQLGDTPWEKGAAAPPLLEWISAHGPLTGQVLVPGCGLGHDVRAIASADPAAEILGLDVARTAVQRAGSGFPKIGRESYRLADLFQLPPDLDYRFDWVFEHTCFCAIDPSRRPDYVRAVAQALKTHGHLLAIFYLDPWDPGEEPEGGGPPFGVAKLELEQLFSRNFALIESLQPVSAFPGREGRELIHLLQKRD